MCVFGFEPHVRLCSGGVVGDSNVCELAYCAQYTFVAALHCVWWGVL